MSNLRKYSKDFDRLKLIDAVFREQEANGIIEKIENLDGFLGEHPEASFLSHMPIFKLDRETTKCRVAFLSNLGEKKNPGSPTIIHIHAMFPGPCLNKKLSTSILSLRFDSFLLCYDIKKAFNQILLDASD